MAGKIEEAAEFEQVSAEIKHGYHHGHRPTEAEEKLSKALSLCPPKALQVVFRKAIALQLPWVGKCSFEYLHYTECVPKCGFATGLTLFLSQPEGAW